MAISSLDLSDFLSGDKKRKDDFVQPLGSVYEEVGFVGVKNYSLADEHYFDEYAINENFMLRAIHYSPITVEPKSAIRAEQHEDINLIPLLIDASADGLEILTKKNEWVPVTSLRDQIIVNVGTYFFIIAHDMKTNLLVYVGAHICFEFPDNY